MPLTAEDKLLVHLPIPPPPGWIKTLAARYPFLKVHWEIAPIKGGIRGINGVEKLPLKITKDVTLLCVYPPATPETIPKVRYVQLASAGYDRWVNHPLFLDPNVAFCNASGAHAPQIAEWVIASWLRLNHHFRQYEDQQREMIWQPRLDWTIQEATNGRMGILGYGAIGRACARLGHALGMEIYAYTRHPRTTPESKKLKTFCVPNKGDPEGLLPIEWLSGNPRETINSFLDRRLDILVICLPLDESTRGLIGPEQFQIMNKHKTFVSNVARGPIINTDALVHALANSFISGAALDVTDPEPLPQDHPLWNSPNVFITPHIAWSSTETLVRVANIVSHNLDRLHQDLPLVNCIKRT